MKTLLKLALMGVIAAVIVKLVRQQDGDTRAAEAQNPDHGIPTDSPIVGGGPVEAWQPDAGEPLRGDNLTTEPPVTH